MPIDTVPDAQAKAWRALDVSVIPPRGYAQDVHLTQEVLNHTGGRVNDATARKWAEDYLRADRWALWGTENLQVDGFFNHLAPGDAVTQGASFGSNFKAIDKAAKSGKALRAQSLTISRFELTVVPQDVKDALVQQFSYPAPFPDYTLLVDRQGPSGASLINQDGTEEPVVHVDAGYREKGFVAGVVGSFPSTLGEIWVQHTDLSCATNDFLRAVCNG